MKHSVAVALKTFALALTVLMVLAACVGTARLYNLETAQIVTLQFQDLGTGRGRISGSLPNGQAISGEYNTLQGGSRTWGAAHASAVGPGGYAWATAQGFSFNQPNTQYGAATLIGGGLVIDCVYGTSGFPSHGQGVCRDNNGGKYRLHF